MLMKLSFIPCLVLSLSLMSLSALAETVPANRNQIAMSFAPLVKQTAPAVVNIYTRKLVRQRVLAPLFDDPMFQQFFGVPSGLTRERMENSLGSGVIVRRDGLVVTSAHVIQGADEIRIVLTDRREFSARTMIVDDKADLAVLQMDGGAENLPALALEDSDNVEVGDLVIAIGNPFGVGQTVTSGIVSALARTEVAHNNLNYFIQTDAAINPGNSGGALVGMDGRLLGINAAIYSKSGGNMGIGFAVPSNMVRAVVEAVEQGKKRVVRPWLGIDGQNITQELASSLGLEKPTGVVVSKLRAGSPLIAAGLKVGDVIQSLNGHVVEDIAALHFRIATLPVGSVASVGIMRAGVAKEVGVTLIAPPEVPARQETVLTGRHILTGVRVVNLSPAVAEEYGLDEANGVIVTESKVPNIYGLELAKGDQILSLNMLQEVLQQPVRRCLLQIRREGRVLNFMIGQ
jgi:Do/DeqQ family serine protease